MASLRDIWSDLKEIARLPEVTIDLMLRATQGNDPFYERMVRQFYGETRQRIRKFPLLRHWRYGVALCPLPPTAEEYFMAIESAARRNYKKAQRLGYTFERIEHNRFLADFKEIHASTDVRQGPMPERIVHGEVKPCNDPPSRTNVHDYPYFGILKDGKLVAYSGSLVAGEASLIEQLYGHAAHHADGVVPMLLIDMVGYIRQHYPQVKYYVNERYYGAGETMRRFKQKFGFVPHKVRWEFGGVMIEVSHIGSSAFHDAFLREHGLARLDSAVPEARLPAGVTHLSFQFPGEHCTECAAPDCHDSCDLFERGCVGRCKRFADGVVVRWTQDPVLRYQVEVLFRPWGQIICVGNAGCVSRSGYARWARWVPIVGRLSFLLQSALRFLPARQHWKAADKIRGAGNRLPRLLNARAARPGAAPADTLLCILGNPSEESVNLEVTVSGFGTSQGGRSFRYLAPLRHGWNRVEIPVAEIAQIIDMRGLFRVCLVPMIQRPALLQFAYIGFVAQRKEEVSGKGDAKKVKLVVLDLDNTLWDGVLIENPDREYTLFPGVREMLELLDRRGILLSVASKNNADDARRVLERLGLWELFLYPQIGWDPKSAGIRAIVNRLNIGMDTVAFVDDSEFERAEVRSALPAVRAYDATELRTLAERAELQVPVTAESRQRRRMYREEGHRQNELRTSRLDYDAFLASCGIVLRLQPLDAANLERVHELVQRTNQLNFSGNRYSRQDLAALLNPGALLPVVLACEDRFGSYGIVGFSLLRAPGPALEMTDLMFSCRIQGKKIEHGYLAHLAGAAQRAGMDRIECRYTRTARNTPAARVFEALQFSCTVIGESREIHAADCRSFVFPRLPVKIVDEAGLEARLAALRSVA